MARGKAAQRIHDERGDEAHVGESEALMHATAPSLSPSLTDAHILCLNVNPHEDCQVSMCANYEGVQMRCLFFTAHDVDEIVMLVGRSGDHADHGGAGSVPVYGGNMLGEEYVRK